MTADAPLIVEPHAALFDDVLAEADAGTLDARFGSRQVQSAGVGILALGLALEIAVLEDVAVVWRERVERPFDALREFVDGVGGRDGCREIVFYRNDRLSQSMLIDYGVARDLEQPGAG